MRNEKIQSCSFFGGVDRAFFSMMMTAFFSSDSHAFSSLHSFSFSSLQSPMTNREIVTTIPTIGEF
jgi:hypothetical protein